MKKILMALGVVFICLVLIGIIGFGIAAFNGTKLDKSSKAYVDEVVPVIISSWNLQEFLDRSSPQLLKAVPQDKMEELFKMFSEKLGKLKEYKGSQGDSLVDISQAGKVTTANYVVEAVFEKANAQIRVSIIRNNEKWQLMGFNVNSEALMP